MTRIVGTPFVDVITHAPPGTALQGSNAQYACATATIEHLLFLQVHFQQCSDHHACCLMRTCSKGQVCIYLNGNVEMLFRRRKMSAIVNNTQVVDDDGFKALLFPLLIPVFVVSLSYFVAQLHPFNGEMDEYRLQGILVEERLLNISFQPISSLFKCFKASLAGHCREDVASILQEFPGRLNAEVYFKIFHSLRSLGVWECIQFYVHLLNSVKI